MGCFEKIFYGGGVNPLPMKIVGTLFLLMLFNAMTMTMVFSFLPKLVKSFGSSEVHAGYFAGFIASALFVGRTLFSFFWGTVADSKGRKSTLIVASTSMMIATFAFGFSTSFVWALVTRFLQGCSMGIVVISKSILVDLCDDTNVALGMAFLAASTSTGLVLGPSLGGFLVFPAEMYPSHFDKDSLFGKYGTLLISVCVVAGFAISITLCIIFLPRDRKKADIYGEKSLLIPIKSKTNDTVSTYYYSIHDREEYIALNSFKKEESAEQDWDQSYSVGNVDILQIVEPNLELELPSASCCCPENGCKNSKLGRLLRSKDCMWISVLYGTYSICATGFDELFPLFAATSEKYNGYSFKTSQIGSSLLVVAAVLVLLQVTVIARVAKRFGPRKVFVWSTMTQAIMIPIIPLLQEIEDKWTFWCVMLTVLFLIRTGIVGSLLTINVLLNNSAEPSLLASANGLGMTFASLGRTIAPSLIGSLFAWSLRNIKDLTENVHAYGFPFNQYFAFIVISFIAFFNSILASFLPNSIDRRKKMDSSTYDNMAWSKHERNIKRTYITVSMFKPPQY